MAESDNSQMAFWEAMKEKYERRNESLKQQEMCLRKRLEQLKQIMEKQKAGDDCDCVPEKLEKPSLVQCLVEKGKSLILGSCKCGDPKVGEEFLCACHIQDPQIPLNVDPNLCPMQEPSSPEGCLNPTCDFYDPTLAHLAENPSTFSLKTTDIYYMDKLADLVKSEKVMQEKIDDLEKREHSYLTAIHDMQEAMKKQTRTDPVNREFKKLTECLEAENKKLRNELEDLRLELKHCFERVEGPLRRSLEDQRDKCSKLENQLKGFQAETKFKEDSYLREISEVKAQLCQACCTMVDLNSLNSKLKDDLDSLQNNCANLEDELLKQQLQEAENILKFKNVLSRRNTKESIRDKGDDSDQDLGYIAKKLGDTLKEVCPCISDVPSGLTETAENIRQLTELVGEKGAQQRKKKKGNIPRISTSSCSEGSDIIISDISPKPEVQKEIKRKIVDDCACSNSSLRLKPRIGKIYSENAKQAQTSGSSSASLAMKPTMKMKASKGTKDTKNPKAPMKETLSKGCTCCPAHNECDHSPSNIQNESTETVNQYSDVVAKKTGPSEELIAVKNLGTLSMPPGGPIIEAEVPKVALLSETSKIKDEHKSKLRKNKLAVDTTCNVLDEAPKDIHVVTTIANTGSLEITTEGPPGIIETKVNYLPDGKVEIVTKLINHHNMDNFLDGTLLHMPKDAPDNDKTQTYGGQYDEKTTYAVEGCFEIDCNESKTCGGLCDNEVEVTEDEADINQQNSVSKTGMTIDEEVEKTLIHGQVVVDNNFILKGGAEVIPFMTREWKNMKFQDDIQEEAALREMDFLAKPKGKRKERNIVHNDVKSEQKILRLSSRQSLTDVEKFLEEDHILESSISLVFPDFLDTISEGDEEQSDSNKSDENTIVKVVKIDENNYLQDSLGEIIVQSELPVVDETGGVSEDFKQRESPVVILTNEETGRIKSIETAKDSNSLQPMIQLSSTVSLREQNDLNLSFHEEVSLGSPEHKHSSLVSLTSSRSIVTSDGVAKMYSQCQITDSFYKLCRNINVCNGKITLKQSKSMYEKRGSRSGYLRICKSATLTMGSLKIDIEKLKLSQKIPRVGDFNGSRPDVRSKFLEENIQLAPISVDDGKGSTSLETEALDVFKEGCNPSESYHSIFKQTYQCYVCRCSNQQEKNDDQQRTNKDRPRNIQGLEERIDRLLEKDPLAECQCVNYLVHNVDKNIEEECNCSKKQHDKVRQGCRCSSDKKKPIPKLDEPKQQGDNVQHDENCTCVDCICNPCHFKRNTTACDCGKCECDSCCAKNNQLTALVAFELKEPPQEIMVMNVSVPCDCIGKCLCSPCLDESKKPQLFREQSQSKPQPQIKSQKQGNAQEASCKRCAHKIPGAKIEESLKTGVPVGSSRIETDSQAGSLQTSLPSTWKNVVGCPCSPPSDDKKAVCDCKPCECQPCSYPEKARKPCDCNPPKKGPKPYGPSGKCYCNTCLSENCRDSSVGDTKTDVVKNDTAYSSSLMKCHCQLCQCLFCSDPNARKESAGKHQNILDKHIIEGEKEPHTLKDLPPSSQPDVCICAKCLCDPCVVLVEQIGNADGHKCDCYRCECDPCSDPNVIAVKKPKDVLNPEDNTEEKQTIKSEKMLSCDCGTCVCVNCMSKPKGTSVDEKNRGDNLEENIVTQINRSEKDKKHTCPCAMKSDTNEPVECNDCFICCDVAIKDKPFDDEVKDTPTKIPCDCCKPCSCYPCPDSNVRKDNEPQMIGDADRAKEEIKNVLNKIGCSCDQVEDNLKPLVKQASNFETTISRMKMKLNNLQQKCKDKDQIIDAMTNELKMRSQSGVFEDLLHDLAHPIEKFTPDFTRTYVCDYLPKPRHKVGTKLQPKRSPLYHFGNTLEPILELDRYLPGTEQDTYGYTKNLDVSGMEIIDIRRVTIDSILIKWRGPPCVNGVTGYQIFVNDELKYRVLSPNRTNAVIDSLDLSSSLEMMLFAITCYGRCEPPALATYKI